MERLLVWVGNVQLADDMQRLRDYCFRPGMKYPRLVNRFLGRRSLVSLVRIQQDGNHVRPSSEITAVKTGHGEAWAS